ncbi:hypothetical protein [Lewinella sp. IMCC34191]|uniref:hypothetical protein n=1 Tax=Lewinella sp. IMCC34191 TaxID=2259172 RepID=UPI000E248C78|nr:hypothetical protein [Lewinella sp. IMCC34191]
MEDFEYYQLDGTTILKFNGLDRKILPPEVEVDFLIYTLTEEWLLYVECHQCGRGDYCKFAEDRPGHPYKKKEIKCGVISKVIHQFITKSIDLFNSYELSRKQ